MCLFHRMSSGTRIVGSIANACAPNELGIDHDARGTIEHEPGGM